MASYILLLKFYEDDKIIVYQFGPNEQEMGRIQLDKKTKLISELLPARGLQSPKFYFERAAQRLARCWPDREFPERMCFAS